MTESVASYSVPEHYVKMYTGNVQAAIAKKGGILTSLVTRGSYTGDKVQVVDFIGPVEFVERRTVYQDTKLTELEHTSRWINGTTYDLAVLIDNIDRLRMIYDPTSPYVERFREAYARKTDNIIITKFLADARTGVDGLTLTPYATGNTVPANPGAGSTGLTVAKLRALRKLIKKRHIDLRSQRPMLLTTAEQIDNLLGEVAVGSSDYNAVKPLVDGEVGQFMGFTFVPYEDYGNDGIPSYVNGSTEFIRQCICWVMDGMHFGTWADLNIQINNRPDKNNNKQIHAEFMAGATRLDEQKVFIAECKE